MKRCIFFLLLIIHHCFSNVAITENEPNSLVQGIVSSITGDLYTLEEDILIQGAEPLRLKRSYISAGGFGKWKLFQHLKAERWFGVNHVFIREANGTELTYYPKETDPYCYRLLNLEEHAKGFTNAARGGLSAQTNLKNQYAVTTKKTREILTVFAPNGCKRTYHIMEKIPPKEVVMGVVSFFYLLKKEELPNGIESPAPKGAGFLLQYSQQPRQLHRLLIPTFRRL